MSSFVISVIAVAAAAGLFSALAAFLLARRRFSSVSEQKDRTVQELRSSLAESELKVRVLEKDVERGNRTIEDMKRDFRTRLAGQGKAYAGMIYRDLAERLREEIAVDVMEEAFPDVDGFVFVGLNALNECEKVVLRKMRDARIAEFCWDWSGDMIRHELNVGWVTHTRLSQVN